MKNKRKRYSAIFKGKVVLEALKEQKTLHELASAYGIHPNQIMNWKKQFSENSHLVFQHSANKRDQKIIDELYRQIGQLTMELDWLKKKLKS